VFLLPTVALTLGWVWGASSLAAAATVEALFIRVLTAKDCGNDANPHMLRTIVMLCLVPLALWGVVLLGLLVLAWL